VEEATQVSRSEGRPRRRAAVAAGLTAVLLAGIAASAGAQSFDQPDRVLVNTTGSNAERVDRVPIGTAAGQGATVVMSMSPRGQPLQSGDRLNGSSEMEVTTDCVSAAPRCVGNPYTYNPTVDSQLILASDPNATGGPGTAPVSGLDERICNHEQHHCLVVFPGSAFDVSASNLPCPPAGCYLNQVVSAYNPSAQPGDVLIVGEDEPDGTTVQDKGRVNSVRLRPDVPGQPSGQVTTYSNTSPRTSSVPVRDHLADSKTVVFSQRLDKLVKDEQLSVSANMTTDISQLSYNRVLVNSRLILATSRTATGPGDLVKRVTEWDGELAEANGFNCTHVDNPCLTQKVGVAHLVADAKRDGDRVPLYVNLVVSSTAAGGTVHAGDTVKVTGGTLKVVRYPANRYG
jgi:hypothetical protein